MKTEIKWEQCFPMVEDTQLWETPGQHALVQDTGERFHHPCLILLCNKSLK